MVDPWEWLRSAAGDVDGVPDEVRGRVVAGVAVAVAQRCGVPLPDLALLSAWGSPVKVSLPPVLDADAWLLGAALEVLLDTGERRRQGSHYTPRDVAHAVTRLALQGVAVDGSTTVCDTAAGGGVFLLAAADALRRAGVPLGIAVRNLTGVDIDPVAVAVTEVALWLWAGGRGGATIEVADALTRPAGDWGAPTVVVGNPPFLGQLRTATARPPDRSGLRSDLAALAGPYTDTSALFAALATDVVVPGGRVALVLPRSFLVARDAGAAREATLRAAVLDHVWLPGRQLFGAAVDVCVLVWEKHPAEATSSTGGRSDGGAVRGGVGAVARSVDMLPAPAPPATSRAPSDRRASWSYLLAGLADESALPSLHGLRSDGMLGDLCTATAGFRDQYYGLIPFVVDDPFGALDDATHAPLVTSGLIDHACSAWGKRTTRYAGRRWEAPRVDVAAVEAAGGSLARWLAGKRVPKLFVAAQTRTIEAVADVDGTWLPSTPVATVVAEPGRHWHVLAVLLSPVATAWALLHLRGTGLSPSALRLPPVALRTLPTPAGAKAWDSAAAAVQAASGATAPARRSDLLVVSAHSMCDAYGIDADPATAWWAGRLPAASSRAASSPIPAASG